MRKLEEIKLMPAREDRQRSKRGGGGGGGRWKGEGEGGIGGGSYHCACEETHREAKRQMPVSRRMMKVCWRARAKEGATCRRRHKTGSNDGQQRQQQRQQQRR